MDKTDCAVKDDEKNLSSDEESKEMNPFSFQRKSFNKSRACNDASSDEEDDNDEDDISEKNSKEENTKRKYAEIESDTSDSDSIDLEQSNKKGKADGSKAFLANEKPKQSPIYLDVLESSDEDYIDSQMLNSSCNGLPGRKRRGRSANNGTIDALRKANEARATLQQVQAVNINEVQEDDEILVLPNCNNNATYLNENNNITSNNESDDEVIVLDDVDKSANTSCSNTTSANAQGPLMKIYLRLDSSEKELYKIRSTESFRSIVDRFSSRHKINCADESLVLHFDGQALSLDQTPSSYDMEDGDLVDVKLLTKNGGLVSRSKIKPTSDLVAFKTIFMGNTYDLWSLRCADPFDKLMKAFFERRKVSEDSVVFQHNGNTIKKTDTPQSLGMIAGNGRDNPVLLNVLNPCGSLTGIRSGRKIKLKIRFRNEKNNSETIHEMSIRDTDIFDVLIKAFCEKNQLNENTDEVKFMLDGSNLNPSGTPNDEDLEGGEIIDVLLKQQQSETNIPDSQMEIPKPIIVLTSRNKAPRPKQFKLQTTDSILKLSAEYIKYYKKKGCNKVQFYHKDKPIQEDSNITLSSLGIKNRDCFVAMENGRTL